MKTITKQTKRLDDYNPDLSYLGTFDSERKSEFAIEHEPGNHRTFNWFNSTNAENQEQAEQDYYRVMQFENGYVGMIGIVAEASIEVGGTLQTITSGGLYGIESDTPEADLEDIEAEQMAELDAILADLTTGDLNHEHN